MNKRYKLKQSYPNSLPIGTEVILSSDESHYNYNGGNSTTLLKRKEIEDFPEFWQEIKPKEWEILSFINISNIVDIKKGTILNKREDNIFCSSNYYIQDTEDKILNLSYWSIRSVKRLSDGEIFTVGDSISHISVNDHGVREIEKITIRNNGIFFHTSFTSTDFTVALSNAQKSKQKLFTTEDGVNMFEGDNWWIVYTEFESGIRTGGHGLWDCHLNKTMNYSPEFKSIKRFSTKEAAEEYILMNKPFISIQNLLDLKVYRSGQDKGTQLISNSVIDLLKGEYLENK